MVVWWRRKLSWSWNPFQNILSHKKFIKSMCCVESTVDNGMQFKYCIVFLCHLSRSKSWWKDFLYKYWKYFFQSFCRKIFFAQKINLASFHPWSLPQQPSKSIQVTVTVVHLYTLSLSHCALKAEDLLFHMAPPSMDRIWKCWEIDFLLFEFTWTDLNWFQRRPVSIVCSSPSNLLLLFDFLHTTRHCRAILLVFQMVSIGLFVNLYKF